MRTIELTDEDKTVCIEIATTDKLSDLELGESVTITLRGKITSLRAPYETEDYSTDPAPGKPRKKKLRPGKVEIELANDPELSTVEKLNKMLDSEEY